MSDVLSTSGRSRPRLAAELSAAGLSPQEIADVIGVSVRTVMERYGIRRHHEPPASVEVRMLASEMPGRYSVRELAEMFGCTERNVRMALARFGLSDLARRAA